MVALFTRAWIEIIIRQFQTLSRPSPSSRGRGLKYCDIAPEEVKGIVALFTRAWIEIFAPFDIPAHLIVALFTRAWIEISAIAAPITVSVSPSSRGRGLK